MSLKEVNDKKWSKIKFLFETEKSGARWRDLPSRYGNWNSIYHKFRKWCSQGLFERLNCQYRRE